MRKLLAVLSLLLCSGCSHAVAPPAPVVVASVPPPAIVAPVPPNEHGLTVVSDPVQYVATLRGDRRRDLVEVIEFVPSIVLDVRYATENNFLRQRLYPEPRVFLRREVVAALGNVQVDLAKAKLGLKVFDGYRPYSVTKAMWEPLKNPDYVADPAKGSRHNRGAAVDVTLVSLVTGSELPMPTPYDDFTPRASQSFDDLPDEILRNRLLLRAVMEKNGFDALPSEWWHFDFRGWREFELLDLPFSILSSRGSDVVR